MNEFYKAWRAGASKASALQKCNANSASQLSESVLLGALCAGWKGLRSGSFMLLHFEEILMYSKKQSPRIIAKKGDELMQPNREENARAIFDAPRELKPPMRREIVAAILFDSLTQPFAVPAAQQIPPGSRARRGIRSSFKNFHESVSAFDSAKFCPNEKPA
jgi:hypothetical protein